MADPIAVIDVDGSPSPELLEVVGPIGALVHTPLAGYIK